MAKSEYLSTRKNIRFQYINNKYNIFTIYALLEIVKDNKMQNFTHQY